MRILHVSDLHLGKAFYHQDSREVLQVQAGLLDQILDTFAKEGCDVLLIAGDIYDRSVPSEEAVILFNRFLNQASERNIPILAVAGNHDSAARLQFATWSLKNDGIHLASRYEGQIQKVTMHDQYGPVDFWLVPFLKPLSVRGYHPDIREYPEMMETVLAEEIRKDCTRRNVLVGHQFITGGKRSESELVSLGGLDNIPARLFQEFDYCAFGHLHQFQKMAANLYYSGSVMKFTADETGKAKVMVLADINEKGQEIQIRTIPLIPAIDFRTIEGTVSELTSPEFYASQNRNDFIFARLTDSLEDPSAAGRLTSVYPRLAAFQYVNRQSPAREIQAVQHTNAIDPMDLAGAFYKEQNGCELSAMQRQLLCDIWEDLE